MGVIVPWGSDITCLNNAWYNVASLTHGSPRYQNTDNYRLKANTPLKSSGIASCEVFYLSSFASKNLGLLNLYDIFNKVPANLNACHILSIENTDL